MSMGNLQTNRVPQGPGPAAIILGTSLLFITLLALLAATAWRVGIATSSDGGQWSSASTAILAAGGIFLALLTVVVVWAISRTSTGRTRVDAGAKHLGNNKRDLAGLTRKAALASAERLGAAENGPGVPLGTPVGSKEPVYSTWEQVRIAVMGPRAGKTNTVCVRELLETKGPAIATSNKRDIVDLTRGPRSEIGQVRVHDLQGLIGEEPTWWWNPLTYCTSVDRADELADVFIAAVTDAGAKQDAYFTGAAKKTLAAMLLAAACGGDRLSVILKWLSNPNSATEALTHLATGGYLEVATALRGQITLTPKQRDGVFGTAIEWVSFLRNRDVMRWAEPLGPDDTRPHFDPDAFAASTDTLYLVSKEGAGTARALTGALTMAVLDAADRLGSRSPGMRLPKPMCAVLDEAANVTRLRQLPDLFSFYGSRGIILSVFLQSWAQGVEAWGENGMKKMWSAANVRLVGSGLAEDGFLRSVAELIGSADVRRSSTSTGRGQTSTSRSIQREKIFDVAEIGEMPGMPNPRALLLASGQRAVLLRLDPWWTQPYADDVSASKDYYEGLATKKTGAST